MLLYHSFFSSRIPRARTQLYNHHLHLSSLQPTRNTISDILIISARWSRPTSPRFLTNCTLGVGLLIDTFLIGRLHAFKRVHVTYVSVAIKVPIKRLVIDYIGMIYIVFCRIKHFLLNCIISISYFFFFLNKSLNSTLLQF